MACEHTVKLFAYDQLKIATKVKAVELRALRNSLHRCLRADTLEEERARAALCADHAAYNRAREAKRQQLQRELAGWGTAVEAELRDAGFPPIEPELLAVPEEEFTMSYMLTQVEMEASLRNDYDSIAEATKAMTMELQQGIRDFDETEKKVLSAPVSSDAWRVLVSLMCGCVWSAHREWRRTAAGTTSTGRRWRGTRARCTPRSPKCATA